MPEFLLYDKKSAERKVVVVICQGDGPDNRIFRYCNEPSVRVDGIVAFAVVNSGILSFFPSPSDEKGDFLGECLSYKYLFHKLPAGLYWYSAVFSSSY